MKKTKKTAKKKFKKPVQIIQKTEKPPEDSKIKKTKIRVIGIGGGGSSIISEIAPKMEKASFVAANTDLQALKTTRRKVQRFPFGQSVTHGLGTGMNPNFGQQSAENEKEKIKKLLEGYDICIIVTCLGGGAGSGAAPVFARISKNLGNITYGIFTLPFKFEGERKMKIAKDALEKLKPYFNAISIIPNERIFQIIDRATPLQKSLSLINKNLSDSLEGLIEMIFTAGLINIDFADFKTILEGRGRLAYLNTVTIPQKESAVKDLISKMLNSPLYPYSIRGAKGVLFNIAGEKELSLNEVSQISKAISELTHEEAKIIFGISQSKRYKDIIKTTILATGCGGTVKVFPKEKSKRHSRKKIVKKVSKIFPKKPTSEKKEIKKKIRKKPKEIFKKKVVRKKKLKNQAKLLPIRINNPLSVLKEKKNQIFNQADKIRKNALQVKKEVEEEEKEMLEKEKFWESPAFLRKKLE